MHDYFIGLIVAAATIIRCDRGRWWWPPWWCVVYFIHGCAKVVTWLWWSGVEKRKWSKERFVCRLGESILLMTECIFLCRISGPIVENDGISIQLRIVSQLNFNLVLRYVGSQFNFRWCCSWTSIMYSYMYISMVSQIIPIRHSHMPIY